MQRKRLWTGLGALSGFALLILDGKTALSGGAAGIELCLKAVIPALFPFFVLSELLISALWGTCSGALALLGKLYGVPRGAQSLLVSAFLGGYPVGASEVVRARRERRLSRESAAYLVRFCNQAGPAFIFGIVGQAFSSKAAVWAVWGIVLLSALYSASFRRPRDCAASAGTQQPVTLVQAVQHSVRTMAPVCGWVTLFSVVIAFLNRWVLWLLPTAARVGVCGLIELTNGCRALTELSDERVRFVLACGMLSFGGFSVTMQTAALLCPELPLRTYLWGKFTQTVCAVALSCALVYPSAWTAAPVLILLCTAVKKRVAFSGKAVYNGVNSKQGGGSRAVSQKSPENMRPMRALHSL